MPHRRSEYFPDPVIEDVYCIYEPGTAIPGHEVYVLENIGTGEVEVNNVRLPKNESRDLAEFHRVLMARQAEVKFNADCLHGLIELIHIMFSDQEAGRGIAWQYRTYRKNPPNAFLPLVYLLTGGDRKYFNTIRQGGSSLQASSLNRGGIPDGGSLADLKTLFAPEF